MFSPSLRTYSAGMSLSLLLVCAFCIQNGISEEEIGSPLRVAQCRARCVQRFSTGSTRGSSCLQGADCYMCWENCQLLQSNFPVWGAICDEKGICFPGCKEACQFHWEASGGQRVPVKQTRGEEVLRVEGGVARWPRPSGEGPFVYVLMRQAASARPWRQITQTVETGARVPSGGTLRLLVVDRDGLVTMYSPRPLSGLPAARAVLETLGKGSLLAGYPLPETPPPPKRINTEISASPTTDRPLSILDDGRRTMGLDKWNLHEVSLIHQKVLVIAEIGWEPPRRWPLQRHVYFVTWEVDGGGLKGNLFTDSTSVTLSLWPETVYHIQVELVTQEAAEGRAVVSEELVVDTGRAVAVEVEGGGSGGGWGEAPRREPAASPRPPRVELALGISAALALFLILAAASLILSARRRRLQHKLVTPSSSHPSPSISRVFPPVVAVVTEMEASTSLSPQRPSRTLHV